VYYRGADGGVRDSLRIGGSMPGASGDCRLCQMQQHPNPTPRSKLTHGRRAWTDWSFILAAILAGCDIYRLIQMRPLVCGVPRLPEARNRRVSRRSFSPHPRHRPFSDSQQHLAITTSYLTRCQFTNAAPSSSSTLIVIESTPVADRSYCLWDAYEAAASRHHPHHSSATSVPQS
jgi:hypothetical protein